MIDDKVRSIVSSLSSAHGKEFFSTIVQALAKAIEADHTYVATLSPNYSEATTIAYAAGPDLTDNFSYSLKDTPCADVCNDSVCVYNGGAQNAYPNDQLLVDMGIDAYVGTPLTDSKGQVMGILVALYAESIENVQSAEALFLLFSGLIAGELERRQSQRQLNIHQTMIDALGEGVLLTNERVEILYANPAFSRISGYSLEEALGKSPGSLLKSGLHDREFYDAMWADLNTKGTWSGEILNRKKSGETYTEWLMLHRFTEPESGKSHYMAIFHDISDLKQAQKQIRQREHYDLLTNIPNRQLLLDRIEQQRLLMDRQHTKAALLCISLDNFRDINTTLGHNVGDLLLQKIARRLGQHTRQSDTLARIGGDEFALLMPILDDMVNAETVALHILDAINAPFLISDHVIEITASIGIAICPDDAHSSLDLINKADQAADHAKHSGKNCFHFFTHELQQRSHRKLLLKNALGKALHKRELNVFFQPIVNIASGEVEKCEALIRWQLDGEFVSPEEFIPIAEEFRLARSLGRFVLEESCRLIQRLDSLQLQPVTIAVNRSIAEFPDDGNQYHDWLGIIKEEGVEHQRISFEITESILAPENRSFAEYLYRLKEAGCSISLDDFGTGYSSLSYLRNFPVDYLKIDRSFVADLESDNDALTLVSTIIAMSKALGIRTIAEGVETEGQLSILKNMNCDLIQGYYFSRPLPGPDLLDYLKAHPRRANT
ncbi:EAL domain-containing protein [Pseudomaricurvus alkylphenolicus]|uniref:putative bifunctional diguanylate cyclase/phosphodiesterase n=1 Tax=Pseudomaricurvus alkylphenolicus TaxID=1306991 RepID=UPI00142010DB|nr:EAL domain-containing protein [Pseudomaricurvus alkylphenolicus]NIB39505.1 EAL domain-containing protein [Pseudomaricurvus alkylphenolicus]